MNTTKRLAVLVTALALSAIGTANASAAEFTSTVSGALSGTATATNVFTTNAGTVECNGVGFTGTAKEGGAPEQHVTVHYSGCVGFFSTVHISPATYNFTANGEVHLEETITITVTNAFGECTVTVPKTQTLRTITYSSSSGKLNLTPHITGIIYHETGGFPCANGGSNGTYTGDSHVSVAGGSLSFDK